MHPFEQKDTWIGGKFEILFYLGNESHLDLIKRIWSYPKHDGPYLKNNIAPGDQLLVTDDGLSDSDFIYGTAEVEDKYIIACSAYKLTDEDGNWVYFGFPLGDLSRFYDIGAYPFEGGKTHEWQFSLANYLKELAEYCFMECDFERCIIGWLTTIEVDELLQVLDSGVPAERWHWYLIKENGKLKSYDQNIDKPLIKFENK